MEKALLVGIQLPGIQRKEVEDSLSELARLTETAGASAEIKIIQRRQQIDPAFFIGEGKANEIKEIALENNIRTLIFDDDLKPGQQKNLEELTGAKIIDRTRLILDIFAMRARSREGKLQVERAQLSYYLPRITKKGSSLDNQVGGIGTRRGPGEKKLEVDQRKIRDKIAAVDEEIRAVQKHRDVMRRKRLKSSMPLVAIVGYTNAGKSTLLNTLSKSNEVYADDKLFATLDPTVRQVKLPGTRTVLFADTVGFIHKLPHMLISAFKGTLEEILEANCILHVIDISDPTYQEHADTVLKVLKDLGADHIPIISAYNKADRLNVKRSRHNLTISALTGQGINELLEAIELIITPGLSPHSIVLPYEKNNILPRIYQLSAVKKQKYSPDGVHLTIETTPRQWEKIRDYIS